MYKVYLDQLGAVEFDKRRAFNDPEAYHGHAFYVVYAANDSPRPAKFHKKVCGFLDPQCFDVVDAQLARQDEIAAGLQKYDMAHQLV